MSHKDFNVLLSPSRLTGSKYCHQLSRLLLACFVCWILCHSSIVDSAHIHHPVFNASRLYQRSQMNGTLNGTIANGTHSLSGPYRNLTNTTLVRNQTRVRRFLSSDPVLDQSKLPMLYIGEVNLADYPQCEYWLEPYRSGCQQEYERAIQHEISQRYQLYQTQADKRLKDGGPSLEPFRYNRNSEYIKQASCCGMWQARRCVVDWIEMRLPEQPAEDCPTDLLEQFRQLPNDPQVRADVLDYCSEYGDGSLICHFHSSATVVHGSVRTRWTITFLVLFSMLLSVLFMSGWIL